MGLGDALNGRQGVFRQSSDPPLQGIVGGAGLLPLRCRSALLAHHGLANYLVINERHTGTSQSGPSKLAAILAVIGCEPYLWHTRWRSVTLRQLLVVRYV